LVTQKIPERFPDLRFGFMEFGSMWLPETIHKLDRRAKGTYQGPTATRLGVSKLSRSLLKDYRIYVACFPDEDLPFVLKFSGEANLMVGSDYVHQDPSQETRMVEDLRERDDVGPDVVEQILCQTPRTFFAL
jgi:hypothetical protein